MKEKLISGIAAGSYIALGAMVYLSIPNVMIGSLFFATGIFLVLNFHNLLFTRVCPLAVYSGEYGAKDMAIAWFGNGVGAAGVALLAHFSRFERVIAERIQTIGEVKLSDSVSSLFIMGFFCAVFVGVAVIAGARQKAGSFAQIFYIWLFITAFVFAGFEHIVADMYYLTAYSLVCGLEMLNIFKVLLCVTAGNIVGGCFTGYIEKHYLRAK